MESFILLHIAQAAMQVNTVDPVALATAAVAFAIAGVAIWLPGSALSIRTLRTRRGCRRVASVIASALVVLALLPSIVPYDHLFVRDAHASNIDESLHASHCHISPGTCSDAPITAGPGQLILSEPLTLAPAMLAVLIAATATVLVGISFRPETPPPLIPTS